MGYFYKQNALDRDKQDWYRIVVAQNQLIIQPNPASDFVIIKNVDEGTLLRVYDITGCLVITETLKSEGRLDVSKLPSGIYLLEADRRQGKLIIK